MTEEHSLSTDALISMVSAERISPYLRVLKQQTDCLCDIYLHQAHLASAFLELINHFEVVLRNAIDQHYQQQFETNNWLELLLAFDERNPFWDNQKQCITTGVTATYNNLLEVKNTYEHKYKNKKANHANLVSNSNFGFWTSLFRTQQYILLGDNLVTIFGMPMHDRRVRKIINQKLYNLKETRNRVAHGKAIIFADEHIDMTPLNKEIEDIRHLTHLLGDDENLYNLALPTIQQEMQSIEAIIHNKQNPV